MNGKLKIAFCLLSSTLCASPHPLPPMFSVTLWALQSSVQLPAHAAHNRCSSAKCIHRHTLTCQCFQFVYKEILFHRHQPSNYKRWRSYPRRMVYFPPETICFHLLLIQGLLQDLIEDLSMIINISEAVTIKPSWYAVILTCLTTLAFVRKWNFSVKKDASAF